MHKMWEYHREYLSTYDSPRGARLWDLPDHVWTNLGRSGWELVSVSQGVYYFKRPYSVT